MGISGTKTRLHVLAGEKQSQAQSTRQPLDAIHHLLPVSSGMVEHLAVTRVPRARLRQMALPLPSINSLAVIDMSSIRRPFFVQFLHDLHPTVIFDVRIVPLFDIDPPYMTRVRALELFRSLKATYFDITGHLEISNSLDARLNPGIMAGPLSSLLKEVSPAGTGPVVVLTDSKNMRDDYIQTLPQYLLPAPLEGWSAISV